MNSSKRGPRSSANAGRVRIIAGVNRGRRIEVGSLEDLRPTPGRVRETVFNWLGQWLDGMACLDLFAGSGALGFEAASRGASRVVMVEKDRRARELLESNRALLRAEQVQVVATDALEYLARDGERFDVVFLDPPFRQNALPAVLQRLPARVNPGARVYVEAPEPLELQAVPNEKWAAGWTELRRAQAGHVSYQLLERR